MSTRFTATVIKADTGSEGGHYEVDEEQVSVAQELLDEAVEKGDLTDGKTSWTGDDLALTMIHTKGVDSPAIHDLAFNIFLETTAVAQRKGLYAAGQDLLVNAPSGNVRGAGPGCAELDLVFGDDPRKVETFIVMTADKCGPGVYNLPLRKVFGDPDHCTGLLLSPDLRKGFVVTVMDMNNVSGDRTAEFNLPEEYHELVAVLRDPDRFAISAIHSRAFPDQQIVSASTSRLHNIAGKYVGKDDPCVIIRTQNIFPAPEEIVHPWGIIDQIVTGDCRGSHNMPILPQPMNSPVNGPYCFPIVAGLARSISPKGKLGGGKDLFGRGEPWDTIRSRVAKYGMHFRQMGAHGIGLAAQEEQAYTGLAALDKEIESRFHVKSATPSQAGATD